MADEDWVLYAIELLKQARDLVWHNNHRDSPYPCPGCDMEQEIDDFLRG